MNARHLSPEVMALLVEGQDDKHVVWHLYDVCSQLEPIPEFGVVDKTNLVELLKSVPAEIRAPDRKAVGIVVDADENPEQRWGELVECLRNAVEGFPCELSADDVLRLCVPDPRGTILPSRPRIGVWMMPNNESAGELEDFITSMIPEGDSIWPMAAEYIDNIPREERKFNDDKTLKAKLFAWLAARKEPARMGAAIGAGDLVVEGIVIESFVTWLRTLFDREN